jgi:polysaccharide chain length determinant protein (PEP-CTERM system associated)
MNVQQGAQSAQVMDLLGMVRRRGKLIVGIAGAVLLAAYWVAMALPNTFTATAAILVEPQSVDEGLVRSGIRESDLNQRLGIMSSQILARSRLSSVVDQFSIYEDKWDEYTREEIVEFMRSAVTVAPTFSALEGNKRRAARNAEFNTFLIAFNYEDASTAANVANHIANDFISEHIQARVKVSQKSLDFMQNSMTNIARQTAEVEAEIAKVKQEYPGRLPEDLLSNQNLRQRLTQNLHTGERQHAEAQSDEAFWKGQVLAAAAIGGGDGAVSPGRRKQVLELELARLISRGLTDKHPDMVHIRAELAVLNEQIRRMEERAQQGDMPSMNPAEENAKSEQRRAALQAQLALESIQRVQGELDDVDARIAETPKVAEMLDALERQHLNLSNNYRDFSQRLQEATVQADMERRQLGEQLRILEPAYPPTQPTSPNRFMLLTVGLMLGIALGVAVGLIVESADGSIHTPTQLQSSLNIPVLATIPPILLEADRIARTRMLIRQAVAASAVVVFCLVGGAATYLWVNGGGITAVMAADDEALSEGGEEASASGEGAAVDSGESRDKA